MNFLPSSWEVSPAHQTLLAMFACGAFGSLMVELSTYLRYHQKPGRMPKRFSSKLFWFVRCCFAAGSGIVVVIYGIENAIIALHIGVATPLILSQLAQQNPVQPASSPSASNSDA